MAPNEHPGVASEDVVDEAVGGPEGIGGWLLIPALTLVGVAFTAAESLLDGELASASLEILAGNVLLAVGSVVLLVLFFARSRHAPGLMVVYYVVLLGVATLEYVTVEKLLFGVTPTLAESESAAIKEGLRNCIGIAIIWIPYMLVSRRVRNTFVR